ncbi:amorpha-4,11-diene synthase [Tanacetum coccineum]
MVEVKWVNEGHIPTTEEYDSVASITGGANLLPTTCYLSMRDIVTKEAVEWVISEPPLLRYSCILGRCLNDVVSHKFTEVQYTEKDNVTRMGDEYKHLVKSLLVYPLSI